MKSPILIINRRQILFWIFVVILFQSQKAKGQIFDSIYKYNLLYIDSSIFFNNHLTVSPNDLNVFRHYSKRKIRQDIKLISTFQFIDTFDFESYNDLFLYLRSEGINSKFDSAYGLNIEIKSRGYLTLRIDGCLEKMRILIYDGTGYVRDSEWKEANLNIAYFRGLLPYFRRKIHFPTMQFLGFESLRQKADCTLDERKKGP